MPRIVSKTGAPTIELSDWVRASGNQGYMNLFDAHAAQMAAGTVVPNAEFDAMVEVFLKATNQGLVD